LEKNDFTYDEDIGKNIRKERLIGLERGLGHSMGRYFAVGFLISGFSFFFYV
jgi:hypothetical protein